MSFEGSKTEKKFIEYRLALNPCFADQGKVEGLSREADFYALQYQDKPHSLGESQITNFSSCIPCLQRSVLKEKYLRHQHPAPLFPRMPNRKDRSFLAAGYLCCRISQYMALDRSSEILMLIHCKYTTKFYFQDKTLIHARATLSGQSFLCEVQMSIVKRFR